MNKPTPYNQPDATPTPRTDAALIEHDYAGDGHYVEPDFARTLERELAQAVAERDEVKTQLSAMESWGKQIDQKTNKLFLRMSEQLEKALAEHDAALAQVATLREALEAAESLIYSVQNDYDDAPPKWWTEKRAIIAAALAATNGAE